LFWAKGSRIWQQIGCSRLAAWHMAAEHRHQAGSPTSELFRGLSDKEIESYVSLGEWETRQSGGFFFREGKPPSGLHLLSAGRVKIYQSTASGRRVLLHIVSPGEAFGLRTLLPVCGRAASALALEESRALVWDRTTTIRLIEYNQQFARNLLWMAVRNIDEMQETYFHLATQPTERRVAWALTHLARKIGLRTDEGFVRLESVSERVLADLAGAGIYTVGRILRGWERSKALTKERGCIVVREPERLAELAEDVW